MLRGETMQRKTVKSLEKKLRKCEQAIEEFAHQFFVLQQVSDSESALSDVRVREHIGEMYKNINIEVLNSGVDYEGFYENIEKLLSSARERWLPYHSMAHKYDSIDEEVK
jgi:hypothetical protein